MISIYLISSSFSSQTSSREKDSFALKHLFFRKRCTSAKFSIHPNEFYMRKIIILCLFFYLEKKKDSSNRKTKKSFISLEGNLFNPHIMMTTSNTYEFNPSRHRKHQPNINKSIAGEEIKGRALNAMK